MSSILIRPVFYGFESNRPAEKSKNRMLLQEAKSCIKAFLMDTSSCIVKLPDKPIRFHRLHEEVFLWILSQFHPPGGRVRAESQLHNQTGKGNAA